jgi:uncharacterized protein
LLAAQETRREVVNAASTPAQDANPDSDQAPGVYSISAKFDRILILRFKYDVDLLAGIEKMVPREKVRNAVILAGAESVRGYQVHQVSNRTLPSKNMFVQNSTAPADLIGMNGYIIDGKVHAHVTLANPDRAFGGHVEPGTGFHLRHRHARRAALGVRQTFSKHMATAEELFPRTPGLGRSRHM